MTDTNFYFHWFYFQLMEIIIVHIIVIGFKVPMYCQIQVYCSKNSPSWDQNRGRESAKCVPIWQIIRFDIIRISRLTCKSMSSWRRIEHNFYKSRNKNEWALHITSTTLFIYHKISYQVWSSIAFSEQEGMNGLINVDFWTITDYTRIVWFIPICLHYCVCIAVMLVLPTYNSFFIK